jgi:hypothetical protein
MSDHCLFCGNPECWIRGKERPNISGMVELKYFEEFKKKPMNEWVCHADCLRRVLKAGQEKYLENGELYDFPELEQAAKGKKITKKDPEPIF